MSLINFPNQNKSIEKEKQIIEGHCVLFVAPSLFPTSNLSPTHLLIAMAVM